jgi:Protein of unknown function (DUF2418)
MSTILTVFSITNAIYALFKTKAYRFFESNVRIIPTNTNARRVKVIDSPVSTPLRFLSTLTSSEPEEEQDLASEDEVWELKVWDPMPVSLRLFTLFSPAHVLVMAMFLPVHSKEPRPSLVIATTVFICSLLSIQGRFLANNFSQQSKDSMTIYKEVSKEYDSKFVQPNARRKPVRDVGIQFPHVGPVLVNGAWQPVPEVVSGTPYSSPRGFQTRANPAYAAHYDPTGAGLSPSPDEDSERRRFVTPSVKSHQTSSYTSTTRGGYAADMSSPVHVVQAPSLSRYSNAGVGTGDGGSLGVYTHAYSPLRKAASANLLRQTGNAADPRKRDPSPTKRTSTPGGALRERFANRDRQSGY